MYDSKIDTLEHIAVVKALILTMSRELEKRAELHDMSKLSVQEKDIFDKFTPELKGSTYGSKEYKGFLKEMKPALDHHYANNRHHPEHFKKYECGGCSVCFPRAPDRCNICGYSQFTTRPDITQMHLIDLVEMFCDWLAATRRHGDGDINKSIVINKSRFSYGDELFSIFNNTAKILDENA